jgi:hypothetical protein
MKIAEALVKVKDLKGKLRELSETINANSTFRIVEENQKVPSIEVELDLLVTLSRELATLKTRIAKTNATKGLTDKINEMEQLRGVVKMLEPLTKIKQDHKDYQTIDYGSDPILLTTVATYNVSNRVDEVVVIRDRIRKLDLELQRLNWQVDLVE